MDEEKPQDEQEEIDTALEEQNQSSEEKSAISADLIRGHINTIILRTLYEKDKYGYEIIMEIETKSRGQYTLKQPTLYSALKRLETQGFITAYWKTDEVSNGGRRKYYKLTDSGREITERNQAEWEYSRTVIDNLISDRSFDFSRPAPTAVDFKILKQSTTRVRSVKADDDEDEFDDAKQEVSAEGKREYAKAIRQDVEIEQDKKDEQQTENVEKTDSPLEIKEIVSDGEKLENAETKTETVLENKSIYEISDPVYVEKPAVLETEPQPVERQRSNNVQPVEKEVKQTETEQTQPTYDEEFYRRLAAIEAEQEKIIEEQRRITHENYMKLINAPAPAPAVDPSASPYADKIDTSKLIYGTKPETERDYANMVDGLFAKTIRSGAQQERVETKSYGERSEKYHVSDIDEKAAGDGLRVNAQDYVPTGKHRKPYKRGDKMFYSSLLVGVIMLLEFTLCLLFKKDLNVSIAYPFVILAVAFAQLLIFTVLKFTDFGKDSRRPKPSTYLSASGILTVIAIFIICIIAILLKVNFSQISDILAKMIIPSIIALNITVFSVAFYLLSR